VHNSITGLPKASNNGIRGAQIKAAISANRELILLYWDIGRAIVDAKRIKATASGSWRYYQPTFGVNFRKWLALQRGTSG